MAITTFEEMGLQDGLMKGIKEQGFTAPTAIQAQIIPAALEGRDVLGSAETGSGKTAAFMIPAINRLMEEGKPGFRCLVLEPTRELAIQVKDVTEALGKYTGLNHVVLFGGVPAAHQVAKIKEGVDIIVATPGRLIDLVWQGLVDFNRITHLVVDEVDRMFDMGFIDDIMQIISFLPQGGFQKMFFSATMPEHVATMINKHLNNPEIVVIGRRSKPAEGITHELYIVDKEKKFDALMHVINNAKIESAIIFTETKHGADKLCDMLKKKKVDISPFHSGYDQMARYDILRRFRRGGVKILVATNVAARGLDITGISHIFNYEVPPAAEDYVHRIGRSARADAKGVAITFASREEQRSIRSIEKLIKMTLPVIMIDGLTTETFPEGRSSGGSYGRSGGGSRSSSGRPGGRGKGGPRGGDRDRRPR